MPDGQDYISKTYRALRDNIDGFNKTESQFRQLISTDTNYRNKVYVALKDNIDGFTRTADEFNGLLIPSNKPVQQQPAITKMGVPLRKQEPFYTTLPQKEKAVVGVPEQFKEGAFAQEKSGNDNLFSLYETANYNQREVMNTTIGKTKPSEYIKVNAGQPVASVIKNPKKQEYDIYENQKGELLTEMKPFVDKTINSMLESGEYKNFFVNGDVLDEGKARDYFDKFVTERGGGQAVRELLLSKFRGEAQNKLQQDDPAYQKILANKMKESGVDYNKYGKQYFEKISAPYVKNAEAITQEAQQQTSAYLDKLKPIANAATQEFNAYVAGLNEQVKAGAIDQPKAQELYGQKLDEYNQRLGAIDKDYKEMVQKIQSSVNSKYQSIERTIQKLGSAISSSEVFNSLPKEEQDKIKKVYTDANTEYYKQKNNIKKAVDAYGNPLQGAIANIGGKGLISGWNRGLSGIGNYLQKQGHDGGLTQWLMSKETDANVLAPAQYEWSKDEWLKRITSSATTSMGASAPILLPTIAAGMATGGTSVPSMIAGTLATGSVGFLGERAQNTGDVYKQIMEQTGDVNKATEAANEYERKQFKTLPLYFVGGLGTMALLKSKGVVNKLGGAVLEQFEELPTEYMQSYDEAQITQGYKKDFLTFVKENPTIAADTFFSTLGQSGAFAATGKMINSLVSKAPEGDKQFFADIIQKEGVEFAINVLENYKKTGILNEADFANGVMEVKKVDQLLRSFDNMGIGGDKAKALLALNYQSEAIKKKIEEEETPAVKMMYEQQLKGINEKIRNFNENPAYAVFTMPGGENSTMTLFAEDIMQMERDGTLDDFIQKTDGITSNDPQLNIVLDKIKERVGNPKEAEEGSYQTGQPENKNAEIIQESTNPVAEEIRQAIRDGKFQGLPVETANSASDNDLIDFIYDQATQTTNDPETGEPTTARPLLDKTFGAELVDKVIAEKEKTIEQPATEPIQPTESYESFLNEMMDFAEGVTDSSFEFRLDVPGMAQKERDGAIKDIRAGKETKRRKQFEDAVKAMFDKQAVSVNRGRGSQSEFTEIPFSDFFAEDVVPYDDFSIWQAPEVEGWFDQEITNLNNETGDIGQDETGDNEQSQAEAETGSTATREAGATVNKPAPQDGEQVPPTENDAEDIGFERESEKKSLLNRAYEGVTDAELKERVAEFGLDYERQTYDEAKAIAKQIINELGIDAALNAVRKGMVKGAEAAFIWAEAIDAVGEQIASADPETLSELQRLEVELLDEFDRTARTDGRFISALQDVYKNSDFEYKLSRQIEEYKTRNKGEVPDEIVAKFEKLSIELEEANKKIAERELELKTLQEQQAMADIKESVSRETTEPAKKRTNKQKAKSVADAIRKGKIVRPGIFLSSSPASAVWDAALEATAKAIEAGGAIADAIKAGIAEIKKSDWFKGLVKNKQDEAEQTFNDYINETAAKEKPKPSVVNGKIQIPHELIRGLVESGIDNIDDLTRAVMEELKTDFPNITERQVRDAITNYGRVVNQNKEEVEVEIRKIKRVGRVVSALEDIADKKRPLRSGLQRDKLDAEERALQKELREALKTLPPDDEAVANKLKTTLDAIKSRLQNQIEDIEREISTGEKRVDGKAEVEYDAEAKALRERRDELKKVRDEIFGDEITDEQRIQRAIRITQRATEKLQEKIDAKDLSVKQKSTVTSDALEAERKKLRELRDEMKQLREQAGIAEQNRLNSAKKRTQKQIEQLEERLANKDFAKKKRTELKADEELIKLKAEKLRIQEEFNKEQYKAELKNRERIVKVLDGLTEVWGLTRVLMATGELSFILIQGGLYTITRPLAAFQSIKKMLSHFGSEKRFNNWERHIKSQPYYPEVKGSKLALSEYDSKLTAREELGVSGWANHIWDWIMLPVKGISKEAYEKAKTLNPLKMIERAGVSYMNNMRLVRFLQATEKLKAEGKTFQSNPEDFKNVADVINTFSGRASLGPAEVMSKHLALIFFSPRNWVSVIKQTIPLVTIPWYASLRSKDQPFYKPSVAQKMAALDYMKYVAATGSLLMSIAYMLNSDDDDENEVVFNPTSSDFLKVKLGNTRIDMFGGRTQMIVYQMRMLLDETTSTSTGKTSQLGSGAFTPTRFDLTSKMVQNKFAPTLGLLTEYLQTKVKGKEGDQKRVSTFGEEYDFADKLKESTQPIFWQTIREVHKDQPESVAYFLDVLAAIGTGIQTYGQKDVKKIMEERKSVKEKPKKPTEETRKEKREKREKELELREQAEKEGVEYVKPN